MGYSCKTLIRLYFNFEEQCVIVYIFFLIFISYHYRNVLFCEEVWIYQVCSKTNGNQWTRYEGTDRRSILSDVLFSLIFKLSEKLNFWVLMLFFFKLNEE